MQLHHIRRRELGRHRAHAARACSRTSRSSSAARRASSSRATRRWSRRRPRLARLEATPALRDHAAAASTSGSCSTSWSLSGAELDRFVAETEADGGPIVSTDDNLYLEYATPKGNVLDYDSSLEETLALLDGYRTPDVRARHLGP